MLLPWLFCFLASFSNKSLLSCLITKQSHHDKKLCKHRPVAGKLCNKKLKELSSQITFLGLLSSFYQITQIQFHLNFSIVVLIYCFCYPSYFTRLYIGGLLRTRMLKICGKMLGKAFMKLLTNIYYIYYYGCSMSFIGITVSMFHAIWVVLPLCGQNELLIVYAQKASTKFS